MPAMKKNAIFTAAPPNPINSIPARQALTVEVTDGRKARANAHSTMG
jgi:hypothetical protein